jgi:hypothetical protein
MLEALKVAEVIFELENFKTNLPKVVLKNVDKIYYVKKDKEKLILLAIGYETKYYEVIESCNISSNPLLKELFERDDWKVMGIKRN